RRAGGRRPSHRRQRGVGRRRGTRRPLPRTALHPDPDAGHRPGRAGPRARALGRGGGAGRGDAARRPRRAPGARVPSAPPARLCARGRGRGADDRRPARARLRRDRLPRHDARRGEPGRAVARHRARERARARRGPRRVPRRARPAGAAGRRARRGGPRGGAGGRARAAEPPPRRGVMATVRVGPPPRGLAATPGVPADKPTRPRPPPLAAPPAGPAPVTGRGGALGGLDWTLPVPSAQVKSAILLAGLGARGRTRVREPLASRDHTERLLAHLGVRLGRAAGSIEVEGGQRPLGAAVALPGDVSSAAFLVVAALVVPGSEPRLPGGGVNPTRTGALAIL